MRLYLAVLAICILTQSFATAEAVSDCGSPVADLHDGWSVGSPKQQGFDSALLCTMGNGVADGKLANVDSIVIVRHGVLVYERYFDNSHREGFDRVFDATTKHFGFSMTKSVTSLLFGIAVDRGLITDLDAPVFSYFPEYAYLRTAEKDRITLRHLLTMSDGLEQSEYFPSMNGPDPYRHFVRRKTVQQPGSSFDYDSGATELLGSVLQRVSGKKIDVLAKDQLFAPLGIKDIEWIREPNGNPRASTGISLRPRDWAKIGQLVLNHGVWRRKQIVSGAWIAQSTAAQIKARESYSYGFQWWLGRSSSNGRVIEWSAALGFNAQKIIVAPELDLVVVFNASRESKNMVSPEIELFDRYILPAALNQ
jgi:CubicO group peptidase (beta-lactamase class C family)